MTEEGKAHSEGDAKNQYRLLSNLETNRTEDLNEYHSTDRAEDEDSVVDGTDTVYHILEGSTPEKGEYDENETQVSDVPVILKGTETETHSTIYMNV